MVSKSRHHLRSAAADIVSRAVQNDFTRLGLGRFPNIICPKAHAGRLAVCAAFEKYYRGNSRKSASRMVQTRYQVLQRYNLCEEDIAHFDLNVCLSLLINTVPASCWTLYYVYSQPSPLEEVRAAIAPHILTSPEGSKRHVNIANIAAVSAYSIYSPRDIETSFSKYVRPQSAGRYSARHPAPLETRLYGLGTLS